MGDVVKGSIEDLMNRIPQVGVLEWIGARPGRRAEMLTPSMAYLDVETGLEGDRADGGETKKRQVTLIQAEHLSVVAGLLGREQVLPEEVRRNLVVRGINLLALKGQRFRVGEAVLEGTGLCPPCSLMEEVLGAGGYNAMRGHGGITARVLESGTIRLGDEVCWIQTEDE